MFPFSEFVLKFVMKLIYRYSEINQALHYSNNSAYMYQVSVHTQFQLPIPYNTGNKKMPKVTKSLKGDITHNLSIRVSGAIYNLFIPVSDKGTKWFLPAICCN